MLAHPDLTLRNRYGGVSVIPAAERGHVDYVRWVATTGIDLDHVNDLGWTALLEAVILGDGGPRHVEVVRALLDAGADRTIPTARASPRWSTPGSVASPRSWACCPDPRAAPPTEGHRIRRTTPVFPRAGDAYWKVPTRRASGVPHG